MQTVNIEKAMAQRIRTLSMLTDVQRAQVREVWVGLDMTDDDKRRWLIATDDEGFTRLARIAMGQGAGVINEMHMLRENVCA